MFASVTYSVSVAFLGRVTIEWSWGTPRNSLGVRLPIKLLATAGPNLTRSKAVTQLRECRKCKRILPVESFRKATDHTPHICQACRLERRREIRVSPSLKVVRGGADRVCSVCRKRMPVEMFHAHGTSRATGATLYRSCCKKCTSARASALKTEVMNAYGNKCECCGEKRFEFLSIDHVGNWGYKDQHRNRATLYNHIKKQGFPGTYRILCYNCNCSIGLYGYCPHRPMIRCATGRENAERDRAESRS